MLFEKVGRCCGRAHYRRLLLLLLLLHMMGAPLVGGSRLIVRLT